MKRRSPLLALTLVLLSRTTVPAQGAPMPSSAPTVPSLSDSARRYLDVALDTLRHAVLGADTLPWSRIRDSAYMIAAGAQRPADTYSAIEWALHRANKHSFLQVLVPGATSTMVGGRIGYVHVPQWSADPTPLADSLQTAIRSLRDARACGWIVDLRANGGGNMWPMLAGVGPLLGDTIVGRFGTGPLATRWYYRDGVAGILSPSGHLDTASRVSVRPVTPATRVEPVAILIDSGTGSSGEAIAIAFRGRPNARFFGNPSAGFATVNRGAQLSDGANMVITTGYSTDRLGTTHGDRVAPDERVGITTRWPSPTDRVTTTAAGWVLKNEACVER
jgi:carboxyl-terminal processing protease